jgi:hypothetical protein
MNHEMQEANMLSCDSEIQERKKIHEAYRNELLKRQLSNAENFDKAILTYSSAGLAFSLGFLKDFVPIDHAIAPYFLFISWASFVIAILLTIFSYCVSQAAIDKQLEIAEDYYLKNNQRAYNTKNRFAIFTDRINIASGICFVIAVILTTLFISFNLNGGINMSAGKIELKNAAGIPRMQQTGMDAAPVPRMQALPVATPIAQQRSPEAVSSGSKQETTSPTSTVVPSKQEK